MSFNNNFCWFARLWKLSPLAANPEIRTRQKALREKETRRRNFVDVVMADKTFGVFDPLIYAIMAVFYVIIMLATIFINGIVILTFYKVRSILCSPASIPILSLALADFIHAVTAMPFGIAANTSRSWYFGHSGCTWYAFTYSVVGLSSILHHSVIAVEKCREILKPLSTPIDKQGIVKITLVDWGICVSWVICLYLDDHHMRRKEGERFAPSSGNPLAPLMSGMWSSLLLASHLYH